ncbi:hypothetical protein LINGRAPRIM_LOCUS2560 [Linum grandiflorum]
MQDRLAQIRRPGYRMPVEYLGEKHYIFRFNHIHDLRWVMDNQPWTYDNALLVMHEL